MSRPYLIRYILGIAADALNLTSMPEMLIVFSVISSSLQNEIHQFPVVGFAGLVADPVASVGT